MLRVLVLVLFCSAAHAQYSFRAVVKDSLRGETLPGVLVMLEGSATGEATDATGQVRISGIPDGKQVISFRYIGYRTKSLSLSFPLSDTTEFIVFLREEQDALSEVVVQGTRSNRSIANTPTRVEVLTEEIDEAATMDPSKVAHLLTHSTGIQVQQTSATSNTANVRIQGLDGRYTQILKDGFPLYGGFSGSLSIMQIPPLDLRQVEYIKGGASTLYGGGAIAGLINLISKDPTKDETIFHLNASHIGAFDANAFMSKRSGKMGFTLLAQRNYHRVFDADGDGFSDAPELTKYNLNPKLFFYFSERTKLSVGGTFTSEKRQGGDLRLMNNETTTAEHFYREKNDVSRITSQTTLEHQLSANQTLTLRNSFNFFDRSLSITPSFALGEYRFAGRQLSSFSEAAYTLRRGKNVLITGLNFYTDDFRETPLQNPVLRNEGFQTVGAFGNYTFDLGEKVSLESGLRVDYVLPGKWFVLPRLSALFKWTKQLTTRIGVGMGYRNASIFSQEAELLGYRNVLPIDRSTTQAEKSYGGSVDIGYKTSVGEHAFVSFNQMFFYTHLDRPLVLQETAPFAGTFHFVNAGGHTQSAGAESFFKFGFHDLTLFLGYTFTHATNHFGGTPTELVLTPRHSLKGDLMYIIPDKWRIGLDYELKSSQRLTNGQRTASFWTFGAMVERTWKQFTFYGNVENYTNIRQTNFASLRTAPFDTPQFTEVWAPLDGIVFNSGFKVRL